MEFIAYSQSCGMNCTRCYIIRRCANCCCSIAFMFSCFFFWRSSIITEAACNWNALTLAAQLVRQLISSGLMPSCKHIHGAETSTGNAASPCVLDPRLGNIVRIINWLPTSTVHTQREIGPRSHRHHTCSLTGARGRLDACAPAAPCYATLVRERVLSGPDLHPPLHVQRNTGVFI